MNDFIRGPEKELCADCGEASCEGHQEHFTPCPSCLGSGQYTLGDVEEGCWDTCPECDGSGEISYE